MASREAGNSYQPRYQYGLRKPLSVDQPTAAYRIISVRSSDSRNLSSDSVILMKRRIDAAIQRYRKMYGQNGEKVPKNS